MTGGESSKREFIRKVIADSRPSFGRFMSQVYSLYDKTRSLKSGNKAENASWSKSQLLKEMKEIMDRKELKDTDLHQITCLAFKYTRATKP